MSAQVISLAAERRRRGLQPAERARQDEDQALYERFRGELLAWPETFKRRILIYYMVSAHPTHTSRGPKVLADLVRQRCQSETLTANRVTSYLSDYRTSVRNALDQYHADKARDAPPRVIARRLRYVDYCKTKFLWALFESGWKRIDRDALRRWAPVRIQTVRQQATEQVAYWDPRIAKLEAQLARGVCQRGPRKGQPYSEARRRELECDLARMHKKRDQALAAMAELEAHADPLRALGVFGGR